ncbi:MAG: hypothetical protein HC933_17440 [Pleurocapsa sp. SU_196_0]|nr:hypothetical protein [Pleurocapsa sp. SU_196_0]
MSRAVILGGLLDGTTSSATLYGDEVFVNNLVVQFDLPSLMGRRPVPVKPLLVCVVVLIAGLSLALGQTRAGLERSSDPGRLSALVKTQRSWLLVGSSFPWSGVDRVFADGLRTKTLSLRILTSSAEVSRWRDWARLGAVVRGHPGTKAPVSILVSDALAIVPDPKKNDFLILSDLETPKALSHRLELAWQLAKP